MGNDVSDTGYVAEHIGYVVGHTADVMHLKMDVVRHLALEVIHHWQARCQLAGLLFHLMHGLLGGAILEELVGQHTDEHDRIHDGEDAR